MSNPNIGQIVPIKRDLVVYRDMGMALTEQAKKNTETQRVVNFLKSSQGLTILKTLGRTNSFNCELYQNPYILFGFFIKTNRAKRFRKADF